MPTVSKVTRELFKQLKDELIYAEPLTVAIKNSLSMKTILMVKGSASYTEYEAQKKAQHPPTQFSIPKRLDLIENKLDMILHAMRNGQVRLL